MATYAVAGKALAWLLMAALTACASPEPADDPEAIADFELLNDPAEPTNRAVFTFNQGVDDLVLEPAARGYRAAVPDFGRERVHDFLTNLRSPVVLANDALQREGGRAGITFSRFVINTTFGVLGLMDVATRLGIPGHDEDFGQTLAVWGVGEGPYLMLPVLGPSNPRDAAGMVVDFAVDPLGFAARGASWVAPTRSGMNAVDTRERYIEVVDDIERTSIDQYGTFRALYRQRRAAEVTNGGAAGAEPGLR